MLKNYLLVAFRNLFKNKRYLIVNTFGLGIALACCITSYILVAFNIEFDDFHQEQKVRNVYRLHANVIVNQSDKRQAVGAPSPIGPTAAAEFAGIKGFVRYAGNAVGSASVSYQDPAGKTETFSEGVVFADSSFFDMFDFPLVQGSHAAFQDLQTVFIDEDLATKYFGENDAVGEILTFGFARGVTRKMTVGGVLKKIAVNSSIYVPILMRFEHFVEMREMDQPVWGDWNVPVTFFELEENADPQKIAPLFDRFRAQRNEAFTEQEVQGYSLVPFKSRIDPNNITWSYLNTPINLEPLLVFVVLGMMILLIACFNLTNTSVAMTANRLKEIGIRKSVGASRPQIIGQLIFETVIVVLLSLGVGYLVSKVIVPEFTGMWGLPYGLADLSGVNFVVLLLVLLFLAAVLVGLYPALFGTRFETVSLLKGSVRFKGTNWLTKSLVAIQFAISIMVLAAGVIFIQNTKYQERLEFGYEKDRLLAIDIQEEKEYRRLEAAAERIPEVELIGTTEHHIGYSTYQNPITYENVEYEVRHLEFGERYFELMDFEFIAGRPLAYENANDFQNGLVVSRAFVTKMGIEGDPLGKKVTIRGISRTIVGVIEDFVDNVYSSKEAEPFIFYATVPGRWRQVIVRAEKENLRDVNAKLEEAWKEIFPDKPYISQYQEDILLDSVRQVNGNLQKIFLFLTVLGGILSAAGIFSMASLNIAKRIKEIGIRKALGASVANVVVIMNRPFAFILTASVLLGLVGAYFGTNFVLDLIYARHIPVSIGPILLSAVGIFLLGMGTTGLTIRKAAQCNPVDTLRDE